MDPFNWPAVLIGTFAAFGLGMVWFSPIMFGKVWSTGSHNLKPPEKPPVPAMLTQFAGTFLLAVVIGRTAMIGDLYTAIAAVIATAVLIAGMDLFSQKSPAATVVDALYVVACGALMIVAQGIL